MSDLISRKTALERAEACKFTDKNEKRKFMDWLNYCLDAEIEPQWIPCSERLPEEDKMSEYYESVIVTLDNGRVVNGCYRNTDEEWWVDAEDGEKYSINVTGHVIAWCPLPEPYKGE